MAPVHGNLSLQFRLTAGIDAMLMLGLGSIALWMNWEVNQLLTIARQQNIASSSIDLIINIRNLGIVNLFAIVMTTLATSWWVQRSLRALHQINDWMATQTAPFDLSQLNFPGEIQQLAYNWNRLLACILQTGEQQRQFTSNIAHELRTPLSLVYAYLQGILRRQSNLTETQCEALEIATSETQRTIQLLQDLLKLARADCGAMSLQVEPLVLNEVLADIVRMTEQFEHRTIQLEADATPLQVRADRHHLMQVFSHLLDNAIYYSDAEMPIILKLNHHQHYAVVQVCDYGCGIPLAQQSNIFEPFYRVDPSRTRATGGAGLGLAIVKSLVTRMGGQVTVQSSPNQGSTFTVTLPALGEPL